VSPPYSILSLLVSMDDTLGALIFLLFKPFAFPFPSYCPSPTSERVHFFLKDCLFCTRNAHHASMAMRLGLSLLLGMSLQRN